MSKKKFKETKVGKILGGLFREGLQSIPVVGTIVTEWKADNPTSPKNSSKLTDFMGWPLYRLLIGGVIMYMLWKGIPIVEMVEKASGVLTLLGI